MNQPQTTEAVLAAYEELPYTSVCYERTHPDVLAMAAVLAGANPPPVARCRVLEIGCASGGNLLPMAQGLPGSTFVGIDLSSRQIEAAIRTATTAGLNNVRFEARDLMTITPEFGQFDYIIAHGVYSWVPPAVQDGLLKLVQQNLSPQGVAYISFSTYPGMHLRTMVREMMQHHTREVRGLAAVAAAARQFMAALHDAVPYPPPQGKVPFPRFYGGHVREEAEMFTGIPDGYLMHDHLAVVNTPLYFHQFVDRLAERGLRYLGKANRRLSDMAIENIVRSRFPGIAGDPLAVEQYVDFATGSMFRTSLVGHAQQPPAGPTDPKVLEGLGVRATLFPMAESPDVRSRAPESFRAHDGAEIVVREPLVKAILVHLGRAWPAPLAFPTLIDTLRVELGQGAAYATTGDPQRTVIARTVLGACQSGLMELASHAPRFTRTVSEKPRASGIARVQARDQDQVANLFHLMTTDLTALDRIVLRHLSGTRDRAAILDGMRAAVDRRLLPDPSADPAAAAAAGFGGSFEQSLENALARLAERLLLVS